MREQLRELSRRSADRENLEQVLDRGRERLERAVAEGREQVQKAVSEAKTGNGGLLSVINEWRFEDLIEIDGIGPVLASKIIQRRPYKSEEDLIASKELPPSAIENFRKAA